MRSSVIELFHLVAGSLIGLDIVLMLGSHTFVCLHPVSREVY